MPKQPQPQWQPLSQLPMLAHHIDGMLWPMARIRSQGSHMSRSSHINRFYTLYLPLPGVCRWLEQKVGTGT